MDALIDLLFLIVLASMANQSKRPIASSVIFGFLKAISIYFIHVSELQASTGFAFTVSITHFVLNSVLGLAIAIIVIKHSKNTKLVVAMLILSILSFLTHNASIAIANLF